MGRVALLASLVACSREGEHQTSGTGSGSGGSGAAVVGHVAYVDACTTGYTKIGTFNGIAVCESPLARTTVFAPGTTCSHGDRVGSYSLPYYQSVCAFDGHLGVAQFASACPTDLTTLEPSANGTTSCGKAGVQLYWRQAPGCPAGWTDAGKGLGAGHICRRDHAGSLVYLAAKCPAKWEQVDEYCAAPGDLIVATLDVCPTGWTQLGAVSGLALCPKP